MSNAARWSHRFFSRLLSSIGSRTSRCIWKSNAEARSTQSGATATKWREAYGVRPGLPALSTTRHARKREQAPRTPNASRGCSRLQNRRGEREKDVAEIFSRLANMLGYCSAGRQSRDRMARSVWSAPRLAGAFDHPARTKAGASSTHSKRFARSLATKHPCSLRK